VNFVTKIMIGQSSKKWRSAFVLKIMTFQSVLRFFFFFPQQNVWNFQFSTLKYIKNKNDNKQWIYTSCTKPLAA
jgi:hypothetical protein